ncbi:hypothetical protein JMJ56_31705 [Belnapia sp. T18]|uniref:Uncharacterized protein n=1 Tax=Belnapia arida TaxID=2804533 RepID=A0ABS1UCW9_9PROT|nr:hypothetical protein [Belnapia arida]MBL6082533.1 hypothetical protein [Belnapia arida]
MPNGVQDNAAERGAETESNQDDVGRRIWGALKDALRSATHLQVVTILGEASIVADARVGFDKLTATIPPEKDGERNTLVTNIDLAFGDISQSLSPKLMDGSHEALLTAHTEMLTKAQQIVQENLRVLKELARDLAKELSSRG